MKLSLQASSDSFSSTVTSHAIFDQEGVFDLLEEISVPMHVQDYTVEFYTKTIENALAEYIQHIAGNKGYFGCAMGRYLMRTAQVGDEFDFIIAAESKSFD